jgi:hypothetical protein
MLDERLSRDLEQRFAGKARRAMAGWDHDGDFGGWHPQVLKQAPSRMQKLSPKTRFTASSITRHRRPEE